MLNKLTYIANLLAASPRKYLIILINLLSASAIFFGYPLMITALEIFISNDVINSNYSLIEKYFNLFNIELSFRNIIILSMALILTGQIFVLTAQLIIQNVELILRKKYLKDLVHGYQKSSWKWIVKDESGRFHSAINREVNLASAAHLLSLKFVSSFIQLIGYIVVSIFISLNATLIAISIFIILSIVNILFSEKLSNISDVNNNYNISLASLTSNLIRNNKILKVSKNSFTLLIYDKISDVIKQTWRLTLFKFNLSILNFTSVSLFITLIFLFHKALDISFPQLFVLMFIFNRTMPTFNGLVAEYSNLIEKFPIHNSVIQRIKDLEINEEKMGSIEYRSHSRIIYSDIYFSHEKNRDTLKNINLDIKPYSIIGIVGSSGSGKSTLLDLLFGLLSPDKGSISYGDVSNDDLDFVSFREKVSYMDQNTTLIDASIEFNLTISNPKIDRTSLWEICKQVKLDGFINNLPNGLATQIGENGIKLSGGERQRLALGRALVTDPEILVLDEATSQLDLGTEKFIKDSIKEISKSRNLTTIIVAHRLSTVKNAEVIYVLENGEIVEFGSYKELQKIKGRLYELDLLSGTKSSPKK